LRCLATASNTLSCRKVKFIESPQLIKSPQLINNSQPKNK
jgi:hypothetical protein